MIANAVPSFLRRIACGLWCVGLAAVVMAGLTAWAIAPSFVEAGPSLARLEAEIRQTYAHVRHLTPAEVADRITADRAEVVLVDVRAPEEHAVSRIEAAIRVDPHVPAAAFLAEHGARLAGRTVVFYCSVGVRSSRLAGRLTARLQTIGARGVYNMSGGIFRWHNEQRTLVDGRGSTGLVHPYDRSWGRYVVRHDLAAYAPAVDAAPRR